MAVLFYPKAGMVLECDFRGYIAPEIVKRRPVVVISPNHLVRPGLFTVVPLSTTPPDPVRSYHYKLIGNPIPGEAAEPWAIGRGTYRVGYVSMDQVREIRRCVALSIGIEFPAPAPILEAIPAPEPPPDGLEVTGQKP